MAISEKEFRGARVGDYIIDAQGIVITVTKKIDDSYSTAEVDHAGIEKLRWFNGKIVDSEFGADVDINHPSANLIVMQESEVW